jgi:TolA-binding protein
MNEYPSLSKEELEALLGSQSHAEGRALTNAGVQAPTIEGTLQSLGAGLRALTAKVNYLEETVKDLRFQLLQQQEQSKSKPRETGGHGQDHDGASPADDSRGDHAERAPALHSDAHPSRLERFGRRGR